MKLKLDENLSRHLKHALAALHHDVLTVADQGLLSKSDIVVAETAGNEGMMHLTLETTGLNRRETFLTAALPTYGIITIKLEAKRKILYERVSKKSKKDRGGEWLYSVDYRDKREFIRKLFKEFKRVPANIRIDTSVMRPPEVYRLALKKLNFIAPEVF